MNIGIHDIHGIHGVHGIHDHLAPLVFYAGVSNQPHIPLLAMIPIYLGPPKPQPQEAALSRL